MDKGEIMCKFDVIIHQKVTMIREDTYAIMAISQEEANDIAMSQDEEHESSEYLYETVNDLSDSENYVLHNPSIYELNLPVVLRKKFPARRVYGPINLGIIPNGEKNG